MQCDAFCKVSTLFTGMSYLVDFFDAACTVHNFLDHQNWLIN